MYVAMNSLNLPPSPFDNESFPIPLLGVDGCPPLGNEGLLPPLPGTVGGFPFGSGGHSDGLAEGLALMG